jgi:uncharacterized membrane protein
MSASEPPRHSESDRTDRRLVNFSDGVVAIAITVIILPLVDSARSFGSGPTINFLSANIFNLEAAGLSFIVIANFWLDHHRLYRRVTGSTRGLIYANLLWLAAIVFLPLPTVLIVDSPGHDPVAAGLYIGTILIADVAARLQEVVIRRNHLESDPVSPQRPLWTSWTTAFLTFLALIIAVAVPATGLYPLLLILLGVPITLLVNRVTEPKVESHRL